MLSDNVVDAKKIMIMIQSMMMQLVYTMRCICSLSRIGIFYCDLEIDILFRKMSFFFLSEDEKQQSSQHL